MLLVVIGRKTLKTSKKQLTRRKTVMSMMRSRRQEAGDTKQLAGAASMGGCWRQMAGQAVVDSTGEASGDWQTSMEASAG